MKHDRFSQFDSGAMQIGCKQQRCGRVAELTCFSFDYPGDQSTAHADTFEIPLEGPIDPSLTAKIEIDPVRASVFVRWRRDHQVDGIGIHASKKFKAVTNHYAGFHAFRFLKQHSLGLLDRLRSACLPQISIAFHEAFFFHRGELSYEFRRNSWHVRHAAPSQHLRFMPQLAKSVWFATNGCENEVSHATPPIASQIAFATKV